MRATAVAVLRRAEDEEVRGVLLQLVQALRYEPADDSRLAAFLVQRAARQPAIAIPLHWCAGECDLKWYNLPRAAAGRGTAIHPAARVRRGA